MVEQELRSDLPLLELDRDQMKQVFYNVIKNSFEAMKRRGILRIRTDLDATHVIISFTDTGGGINLDNNDQGGVATINFTGGLAINTSASNSTGFSATMIDDAVNAPAYIVGNIK